MKMFSYDISDTLRKKLLRIGKKDKALAENFYKKLQEVVSRDRKGVEAYKNLKSPLNEFKRIHLTSNYILLFAVEGERIIFIDIRHWDSIFGK